MGLAAAVELGFLGCDPAAGAGQNKHRQAFRAKGQSLDMPRPGVRRRPARAGAK
jgi:hypothetical protein